MLVIKAKRMLAMLAGWAASVYAAGASADYALNLRPGVTSISREAYDLHMLIMWICVAVMIGGFVWTVS